MESKHGVLLWLVVAMSVLATQCTGDTEPDSEFEEDLELLWAATFGDSTNGSYSRYLDADETNWRSRYQYRDLDTMNPAPGVLDCGTDPDLPIGLFSVSQVYLFDAEGQPRGPGPNFERRDRPSQIFDPEEPRDPDLEASIEPIRLPLEPDAGQEEFVGAVNELLARARDAGVEDPSIGLDFVLSPSMFHGYGSEDPTPAPADATSTSLDEAAEATKAESAEQTIWIVDFGLPSGASGWPSNISGPATQDPPPAGAPLTAQYGHGLMVASVAAQAAPSASIEVLDVAEEAVPGNEIITVSSIDRGLLQTRILQDGLTGILNFSIGSYDCPEGVTIRDSGGGNLIDSDPAKLRQAFEAILEPYVARVPIVAAAGNDNTDRELLPAALGGVIGVGAVDDTVLNTETCLDSANGIFSWSPNSATEDANCQSDPTALAPFSNHGGQVAHSRPGVDLIVHYPLLDPPIEYNYFDYGSNPIPLDTGKVRISGTSLAAPFYAANP